VITNKELAALQRFASSRLGHAFSDPQLLAEALTHRSLANEAPPHQSLRHNERLEFLGDAVLGMLVAEWLMSRLPDADEGELTRLRASLVCMNGLAGAARSIELGKYLRLGRGEELSGGRDKDSLLADALEALIGAIYLDGGLPACRRVVHDLLAERLEQLPGDHGLDPKSLLQQHLQRRAGTTPSYRVVGESGPDHLPTFTVEALAGNRHLGAGQGHSKKEAEQAAAAEALKNLSLPDHIAPEDE